MIRVNRDQQDRYLVIGNPVAHSRSPQIHAAFALQTQQNLIYEHFLAPIDGFATSLQNLIAAGACGANITLPFKLEAHALATRLTERAAQAGAVNTLSFIDGQIVGDNTDGIGLVRDLKHQGIDLSAARIVLLGAGGAARGVIGALREQGAEIYIVNRSLHKAQHLAELFAPLGGGVQALSFEALGASASHFDIIINATAASLQGMFLPFPPSLWKSAELAYDMMYGATPTTFMQQARAGGARRQLDGLGMLVEQAAESFYGWRKVRPETRVVLQQLRKIL